MLSRHEIVGKGFLYRRDLISLRYSDHAKERLVERTTGNIIVAPSVLRVSESNIYTGLAKGNVLKEVTIRLDYKNDKWMFLVILLKHGIVKTIWIDDKKKAKAKKLQRLNTEAGELREEVGVVQENLVRETSCKPTFWQTLVRRVKELLHGPLTRKGSVPRDRIL